MGWFFHCGKDRVKELSPVQIAFFRFAVASPFMLLVVFLKKKKMRMPLNEFPALIVLACLFSQVHFLSSRAYISPRTDRLKYAFALKL